MNERLQQLVPSANRPNGSLQALALDGAHTVCGELSAITRFEPATPKTTESHRSGGQCEP